MKINNDSKDTKDVKNKRIEDAIKVARKSHDIIDNKYDSLAGHFIRAFKFLNRKIDFILINTVTAKILSFSMAILLFFAVSNSQETNMFGRTDGGLVLNSIPLEVLYDQDKYVIKNIPELIDVSLIGEVEGIMRTRNARNYKFVADLRQYTAGPRQRVDIVYTGIADNVEVRFDVPFYYVDIFERVEGEFEIQPEIIRRDINNNLVYIIDDLSIDRVKVKDSQEHLDMIGSVRALVDVKGRSKDFTTNVNLMVYDLEGQVMNTAFLLVEEVSANVRVLTTLEYEKEKALLTQPNIEDQVIDDIIDDKE